MTKSVKNGYLYVVDEQGTEQCLCENIIVKKVKVNLVNGEHFLCLGLWSRGVPIEIEIPRSDLNRSIISKLMKYGLTLVDCAECTELLLEHLLESEMDAERTYFHEVRGYATAADGTPVYLLHHPIGFSPDKSQSKSTFHRPEITAPVGTLDEWISDMEQHVIGRGNMELALSLGACGQVFYILKKNHYLSDMPIIALVSKSSCGKTLSLRVMASLYGSPEESGGLLNNFNCTENAFYAQMESSYGLTLLFDELTSQSNSWDFAKLIYTIVAGNSKKRCNTHGGIEKDIQFFAPLVITGERSVLSSADKDMEGEHARVLELRCRWTESAEHAETLEQVVRKNYGVAGPVLAQWIWNHEERIVEIYSTTIKKLNEQLDKCSNQYQGILRRKFKVVAGILTTAEILMEVFSFSLNLHKINEVLCSACFEQLPEQSPEEAAYDAVMALYAQNSYKCPQKVKRSMYANQQNLQISGIWGERIDDRLWITEEKLKEVIEKKGFGDLRTIKRAWHEAGLIRRDGQRHYVFSHQLNGVYVKCSCLTIKEDVKSTSDMYEEISERVKNKDRVIALITGED